MTRRTTLALTTLALLSFAVVLPASDAIAQQKQRLTFKIGPENTKYTQQHTIDVGDVPGHQIRIYEIRREFPKDPPAFDGVRVVEQFSRGSTDYIDLNGPQTNYGVWVLESGDKLFTRGNLISESAVNSDGSVKTTSYAVSQFTGGTGKFRNIRGSTKTLSISNIKAGVNESQYEIEYWIEK
jgi:hypothetical protein